MKSNVLPEENTFGQQSLDRYIRKRSYEQSPILNAMYNSDQQMKQIVQAPLLTPYKKSTLYSNEFHRFQSFKIQLQNQLRSQNNLQTQLQNFLTTATKSLKAALKKPRYTYEPDSKKQSPLNPPGIPATPKAYFLTPPPTIEHPERLHWHTGDADMDESDSDESKKEHPDDTDVDESGSDKSEREHPDGTDVEETGLGETEGRTR